MSGIVGIGEITGITNDIRGISENVRNGTNSGGDIAAAANAAMAIAQALSTNPIVAELGGVAAGASLAAEIARLQLAIDTNNTDAMVDASLGIVAAAGGIIALVPTPQSKALGIAISLSANAAKELYRNREGISGAIDDIIDMASSDALQVPYIVHIDPQTLIDNGLIDPQTLLPKVPNSPEQTRELADRVRRGDLPGRIIPTSSNTDYHGATRTRPPTPRDPLAIDLDGDGIETVGSVTDPVLFDHNADGIRAGTGWVRPDDAWLVLDRNGNGVIDSGRELFGVDTLLSGTPGVDAVYATTGFQALAALDVGSGVAGSVGHADNVFNASDAAFAEVRLWRDLNQDGVSQATELFTLAQQNIASISLAASTTNINLGNGNTVSGTATVTRSNGMTTLAETVGVAADTTAANLNLTNNPFYREFTTPVAPSTAAQALPEMGGSGWVRDLREAMSLGTPQGDALAAAVQAFANSARNGADNDNYWSNAA